MRAAGIAVLGWIVPGSGALIERRYARFTFVFLAVCGTFAAGVAMQGGNLWPSPAELQGLDGMTMLMARGSALARSLAGGPWLIAHALGYSQTYIAGRVHEYGTTLLTLAGLFNLLALADGR